MEMTSFLPEEVPSEEFVQIGKKEDRIREAENIRQEFLKSKKLPTMPITVPTRVQRSTEEESK